ncbi:hypothetical protein DVH26_10045 [Paenibacillus sp. H1-7]|uniref:ATP-binding protein n=1 Tax=Paenibacillus sp. H1-7 TaxID=2282849 RepID=UPI001EF988F5|nr:ATP-binding protein [Paenibacillus sp. H1-7]ULL14760.1 hypothetical protein DVH26_10045 [Paenibacillus sp. H1-7]
MAIISIEGASAVGKTTTSSKLASASGTFHIPEINTWWKQRPVPEYREWWFERQADRWEIAKENEIKHSFVIIDIDLFQPFWYNWAFDFTLFGNQSFEFVSDYYRELILQKKIGFPDKYYLLTTNEAELRKRKMNDSTIRRGGFEMNLQFIEPQKHYFKALNSFVPSLVTFIESVDVDMNINTITNTIPTKTQDHTYSIELFDYMVDWLSSHKASEFQLS